MEAVGQRLVALKRQIEFVEKGRSRRLILAVETFGDVGVLAAKLALNDVTDEIALLVRQARFQEGNEQLGKLLGVLKREIEIATESDNE